VLVAILLVGLAVAGTMHGIKTLGDADAKAKRADLLQELALEKLDQLEGTEDPNSFDTSGDFSDRNHPEITWTLTMEQSDTQNLDEATITTHVGREEQSLKELIYVPPTSSTSTTPSTTGGTR
jgi:type II secretory pathway pseudopilin PulG